MTDYSAIKDGDTVYVITTALGAWFNQVYPELKNKNIRIFLVTGDAVKRAPSFIFPDRDKFHQMMNEGIILHWFCQNCDYPEHDRITPIPLGIDYHTLHRQAHWGEPKTHYARQDAQLDSYGVRTPKAWAARKHTALLDAHLTDFTNQAHRQNVYNLFKDKDFVSLLPGKLSRTAYWKLIQDYRFIISPLGAGLDCHRTWEAIILGAVPVIKRTAIAELFEGLPVIMVDQYKDFTKDVMDSYVYPDTINEARLSLSYWNNVINDTRRRILG